MNPRKDFFQSLILDSSKRILELGPLNGPIADKQIYPNTFYCDIRSTEEIRRLYSGNDYLKATGILIDPESIIPVDYVIRENYKKTFENVEKFDYVIASHVLEHMPDLIFSLQDISSVLKPGGIFCILYPDKRYCFDHFRTSASFRDAYNVFRNGTKENAPMVLDFFYSVIPENNPHVFWEKKEILNYLPETSYAEAIEHYEQVAEGMRMDDVHYWPFTDMDFLKFLYDCTKAQLLPFRCISFYPCQQNDQQFMVALQYDPAICSQPKEALQALAQWMEYTLPDYYSSKDITILNENERLQVLTDTQSQKMETLQKNLFQSQNELNDLKNQNQILTSLNAEQQDMMNTLNSEIIRQQEVLNTLNSEIIRQQETMNTLNSEIIRQQEALKLSVAEKDVYQQISDQRFEKIKELEAEMIVLQNELQKRLGQLELMENSKSWKITKPLRTIAHVFRNPEN